MINISFEDVARFIINSCGIVMIVAAALLVIIYTVIIIDNFIILSKGDNSGSEQEQKLIDESRVLKAEIEQQLKDTDGHPCMKIEIISSLDDFDKLLSEKDFKKNNEERKK